MDYYDNYFETPDQSMWLQPNGDIRSYSESNNSFLYKAIEWILILLI